MLLRLNIRTCVLSKVLRPINLGKNLDCMFLVFYSKWVGWKCNAFKSYPSDLWQICTTTTKGFGEGSRDWNRTFDLWLTRLYCPKSKNLKVESWLRRSTRNCRLLKAQLRTATYGMYVKWKKRCFLVSI